MSFDVQVFSPESYAGEVASLITRDLPAEGTVILTGGSTIRPVYEALQAPAAWSGLHVLFSDERCVPPDHAESNYRTANELFLRGTDAVVHRMPGELDPSEGARRYHDEISELIANGPGLAVMGMGADCHVGALYPGSPALADPNYCSAVQRPDGLMGLTLTPSAMQATKKVRLVATGDKKAAAVARVVRGDEGPETCPVRLLASHEDVVLWLDEAAASKL